MLLVEATSPLPPLFIFFLQFFPLRPSLSSISSLSSNPLCSLPLLSPFSSCPAVSPHFWRNDSQLSTPHLLSWPPSRPDSSTDEITHWVSLSGHNSVRAISVGSLFCLIYSLAFFFLRICFWYGFAHINSCERASLLIGFFFILLMI